VFHAMQMHPYYQQQPCLTISISVPQLYEPVHPLALQRSLGLLSAALCDDDQDRSCYSRDSRASYLPSSSSSASSSCSTSWSTSQQQQQRFREPTTSEVDQLFHQSWNKNQDNDHSSRSYGRRFGSRHVLRTLRTNREAERGFHKYIDQLDKRGVSSNIKLLWHGTSRRCSGTSLSRCGSSQDCNLCGIGRSGFLMSKAGGHWQRFGSAIYFASNSSKAHDYSTDQSASQQIRVLLLCAVVLGNCFETTSDMPHLAQAPAGHDSVHGKVGGSLNYEEFAIYNDDAVIPLYAVEYSYQYL
jgi:hypothetical protein